MNEDVLAALFDHAAVLIVVLDQDGRIVRFNRTCELITGYREAEMQGEYIWQRLLDAAEATAVTDVFRRLQQTRERSSYTNYWLSRDGERRLISWRNSVVTERGRVRYVIAIGSDVTDSERERLIRQKKNAAIEHSLSAIALADLDGTISYANPAFLRLWDYRDVGEVLGRQATEFWCDPARAREVMATLFDAGSWVGELVAQRADAGCFTAELTAVLVRDEQGAPLCLMASFLDVTPLQAARAEAQRNQRRFEALFNGARDGIVLADAETMAFVIANPRWLDMTGYSAAELGGMHVSDIHPSEYLARVYLTFGQLARGEIEVADGIPVLRKDGTLFWAEIAAAEIEFEGKIYLSGLFRDVSDRRQAEQELSASEE